MKQDKEGAQEAQPIQNWRSVFLTGLMEGGLRLSAEVCSDIVDSIDAVTKDAPERSQDTTDEPG